MNSIATAVQRPVWHEGHAHEWPAESAPPSDQVDYAIIGAGFSGLWTAYYLSHAHPQAVIGIFESKRVGFGASGRNGGWCSGFFPLTINELADQFDAESALTAYRESFRTLDEIERVVRDESIACSWHRGGTVQSASTVLQAERLQQMVIDHHELGLQRSDVSWLPAHEVGNHVRVAQTHGAVFSPHCATINPFALVLGLARVVRSRGVKLWEHSPVLSFTRGVVRHARGEVRARFVIQATEGYSHAIRQTRRRLAPLYSLMVATEPLANDVLATINWQNRPTFNDGGRMIIYAQLTADNRIAFGGRGAPYHFGSRIADEFDLDDHTHLRIADSIARHFPAAAGAKITHRWGGPLGVPRDWTPTVIVDREAGYARLGGYTGDGVAATNLLARLTVDRLVERDSVLTGLPFNDHQSPRWEIEPLRYLGINLLLKLSESIDRYEERYAKVPRIRSKVFDALL